jgi:hypothetical protein
MYTYNPGNILLATYGDSPDFMPLSTKLITHIHLTRGELGLMATRKTQYFFFFLS